MRETDLYEQIAQYMNLKYPTVIYHFDLSGLWTPSHQARNLYGRLNKRAWPDLFIAYSREILDGAIRYQCAGLFLELKKDGTSLFKKDGVTLRANPHHIEQAVVLESLRAAGYRAEFAVGFDTAVKLIDEYLGVQSDHDSITRNHHDNRSVAHDPAAGATF